MTLAGETTDDARPAVIRMQGIEVTFPGVRALDGVDFRLLPGEIHALMGENGAGKSTLIKTLTGVNRANAGRILLDGRPVSFAGPGAAQAAGISTVYQEVNLCPNLTVAENILLGREPRRFARIDARAMRRRAAQVLSQMGLAVDPASQLSEHSVAVQQLVAIARAVQVEAKVLILDEPTSSLDADEVAELFRIMRDLRAQGVAILFVSHFLDQVYEISDRMTVLRNGRLVGEYLTADLPRLELVQAMLGRELRALEELEREAAQAADSQAPVLLDAAGLGRAASVQPFDLQVRPGEVVGLAGLLGSGRTEIARLLFGADRADAGTLHWDGERASWASPAGAVHAGIGFCSEDRKREGIVADLTVRENVLLALQARRGWVKRIPAREADALVARLIEQLDVRPADPRARVGQLSGGNQQKVLLARWLAVEPRMLVLDEPTRGIDVGAKAQIQQLVRRLAADGVAVVFISAELEEVLRISDRVVVVRDRRIVADLPARDLTVDDVMPLIASGATQAGPAPEQGRVA
ncbi:MAG: sugar ABC transporter ATP-binding protein [Kineosporiaceae bacterium]